MIDGMWWLLIIVAVIAVLWLIAAKRGAKSTQGGSGKPAPAANDALQKTATLLAKSFSEYRVTRRANHLLISQQDKKVAMITMDKKIAVGQRRLGDVPIINYHRVPSQTELSTTLQTLELH